MTLVRTTLALGLAAAISANTAGLARADISAAARAFSDGQAAQLEGNNERAAQSYELAFNISPSKEALRSAVRARQQAGQLPRAATLAQLLLTQYPDDAESTRLANDVIAEARGKLARLAITCAAPCTVAIGGRATSLDAAPSHVVFTAPGPQRLEVSFDGDRTIARDLTLKPGDELALPFDAPPPAAHPAAPPTAAAHAPAHDDVRPLSPGFALAGAGATLVLASVTLWSGLDTSTAHDAYAAMPTHDGFTAGRSKQLRTNILLGATAATGLATGLIAAFWTQWRDPATHVTVAPTTGGVALALAGRF